MISKDIFFNVTYQNFNYTAPKNRILFIEISQALKIDNSEDYSTSFLACLDLTIMTLGRKKNKEYGRSMPEEEAPKMRASPARQTKKILTKREMML